MKSIFLAIALLASLPLNSFAIETEHVVVIGHRRSDTLSPFLFKKMKLPQADGYGGGGGGRGYITPAQAKEDGRKYAKDMCEMDRNPDIAYEAGVKYCNENYGGRNRGSCIEGVNIGVQEGIRSGKCDAGPDVPTS